MSNHDALIIPKNVTAGTVTSSTDDAELQGLPHDIREKIAKKRLVFTVTTGRSGSSYLMLLIRAIRDIASYHEATPDFVEVMREAQMNANVARAFWVERKLPAIARNAKPVYVETSHLFCKGFAEPLLKLGIVPDLMFLSRSNRAVAKSLYNLGTIPGRSGEALRWYLSPTDPGVLSLPNWEKYHDYQLCYWYCLEIERRKCEYEKMFAERGGKILHVDLEDLGTLRGFWRLLEFLRVPRYSAPSWWRFLRRRRHRINGKTSEKKSTPMPRNVGELEREIRESVSIPQG